MSPKLYECNAMDTALLKTASKVFGDNLVAMRADLEAHIQSGQPLDSVGVEGGENLDPSVYMECLDSAQQNTMGGGQHPAAGQLGKSKIMAAAREESHAEKQHSSQQQHTSSAGETTQSAAFGATAAFGAYKKKHRHLI